jgi:hypothetical protein
MNYKVGLRNKTALCITLPDKAAAGAGIAQKDKVTIESQPKGYVLPSAAIVVKRADTPQETPIEVKQPETAISQ